MYSKQKKGIKINEIGNRKSSATTEDILQNNWSIIFKSVTVRKIQERLMTAADRGRPGIAPSGSELHPSPTKELVGQLAKFQW